MIFPVGATSQSVDVQIVDDSGLPVTGLVAATFPTLTYSLAGANADVAFPALSDLATITTAYASGGVKERTNGYYRLDLPNGVFTTAGQVRIMGEATGKHVICQVLDVGTAVTPGTGTGQLATTAGAVTFSNTSIGSVTGSVGSVTAGVTVTTNNDKTGYSLTQTFPANFAALGISASGHISNVDTLTTYTGNTPQTGDSYARIGATGSGLTSLAPASTALSNATWTNVLATSLTTLAGHDPGGTLASTTNITAGTITTVTNLTNAPTVGDLTSTMKTSVENAVWNATESSHLTAGSTGAALNAAGSAGDPWTTALPGSYTAGQAGYIVGHNLNAAITSLGSPQQVGTKYAVTLNSSDVTGNVPAHVLEWNGTAVAGPPPDAIFISSHLAIAATANTITLSAAEPAVDNYYRNCRVFIRSGKGAGQTGRITGYVGATNVATIDGTWAVTPDATSLYVIMVGAVSVLAASQSFYAPAKAGDQMDLVNAPNANAVTAIQNGLSKPATPQTIDQTTLLPATPVAGSVGEALKKADTNLDATVSSRSTYAGGQVASVAAAVTVGTNNDKTGYGLAADGLDSISTAAPSGVAANFREMLVAVYRRFFKKTTLTATQLKTYADDGTTVLTTQAASDDGVTQTLGDAS